MDKDDVYRLLQTIRDKTSLKNLSHESYYVGYEGLCELMPTVVYSPGDRRMIFDLLGNGEDMVDSRDLIMTFTNFVAGFELAERCKLAFEMYDVDRSGFLCIDEIEAMMISTNLATHDLIKRRAENFMLCADTDRYFEMCFLLSCEICNIFFLSIFCFYRCAYCRSGGITIDELIVAAEKLPNLLFPSQTKKY